MGQAVTSVREAFERVLKKRRQPTDGYSVRELVRLLGWSDTRVRETLRQLLADGSWEVVPSRRQTMSGTWQTVRVYRVKRNVK